MVGGDLSFMDPRPAAKMDMRFADESILNIKPVEGQGLIFPGWLEHYVFNKNVWSNEESKADNQEYNRRGNFNRAIASEEPKGYFNNERDDEINITTTNESKDSRKSITINYMKPDEQFGYIASKALENYENH